MIRNKLSTHAVHMIWCLKYTEYRSNEHLWYPGHPS
jgi:hypothetical protein